MGQWLVDSAIHKLDCGDNSCKYASQRGGMRTNGGCRCSRNNGKDVEFFLSQNYHAALKRIQELEIKLNSMIEHEAGADI